MRDIGVVVTFSSRTGATEKLALAAALGAVQAKAKIRLRWLPERVDDAMIDSIPGWRENRQRMTKEYIAPREIDLEWADVLILAIPARDGAHSPEIETFVQAVTKLHGKLATAFSAPDLTSLCSAFAGLDLVIIPPDWSSAPNPLDAARLLGHKLVEAARNP